MTTVVVEVQGAQATARKTGPLVRGMVGVPVTFAFNDVWDGLSRTVVFRAGNLILDDVNVDATSTLPWEMTSEERDVYIGVYGTNSEGTLIIPTVWAHVGMVLPGATPSGDSSTDPHLPVWAQLQTQINELKPGILTEETKREIIDAILAELGQGGEDIGSTTAILGVATLGSLKLA